MGIMSIAGGAVALLVATLFASMETASVAFVVVNVLAQNLCGYFLAEDWIPWWFRWIYFINFFRYAYQGAIMGQRLVPQHDDDETNLAPLNVSYANLQLRAWEYSIIAVLICVGLFLVAWFVAWFKTHDTSNSRACNVACSMTCIENNFSEGAEAPTLAAADARRERVAKAGGASEIFPRGTVRALSMMAGPGGGTTWAA